MFQPAQPPAIVKVAEPALDNVFRHRGSGRRDSGIKAPSGTRLMVRIGREEWDESSEQIVTESVLLDCTISNGMTPQQIAAKHGRGYSLIDFWVPEEEAPF